jgi:hypothetical protein
MTNNNFNKLSIDDLNSKLKSIKAITSFIVGLLIFIIGMMIYGYFNQKGNIAYFLSLGSGLIALIAVLPIQFINMKKITDESNSRKSLLKAWC